MRLIIAKNWSILLGFIITTLALSGMLLAVFFPAAAAVDLTPNRSINTLEVSLKNQDSSPAEPEDKAVGCSVSELAGQKGR